MQMLQIPSAILCRLAKPQTVALTALSDDLTGPLPNQTPGGMTTSH